MVRFTCCEKHLIYMFHDVFGCLDVLSTFVLNDIYLGSRSMPGSTWLPRGVRASRLETSSALLGAQLGLSFSIAASPGSEAEAGARQKKEAEIVDVDGDR